MWDSSETTTDLSGADTAGFNQLGDAALVHRADGQEYVVTAARTTAEFMPHLFAIRVDGAGVVNIAPASVITATRPWIESAGNAAVFASPGGDVRYWAGEAVFGDRSRVAGSVTGVASTAAAIAVRGEGDGNRLATLVPTPSSIAAFTPSCATTDSLEQCGTFMPGPNSPNTFTLSNIAEPVIAATVDRLATPNAKAAEDPSGSTAAPRSSRWDQRSLPHSPACSTSTRADIAVHALP